MENKEKKHENHHQHHHILSTKMALGIGGTLLVLTWVTVTSAGIDLGRLNFFIAFVIASIKATLVALIFMNLKYDRRENAVIFASAFLFLAIFISLTVTDLFFRGDVYVKGPLVAEVPSAQAQSSLRNPWISTPALISHGKEIFAAQCVTCHGSQGKGDGPAALSLNPHPRNFTQSEGWKNGRKPSQVFKTLREGIPNSPMSSFATLPVDDRWALVHYVLSLGPSVPEDAPADLAKIGMDPTKQNGGAEEATQAQSIPVELAIEQMVKEESAQAQ